MSENFEKLKEEFESKVYFNLETKILHKKLKLYRIKLNFKKSGFAYEYKIYDKESNKLVCDAISLEGLIELFNCLNFREIKVVEL